mmetsp:Transcript_34374/g.79249  ORF Transcript_34374/g.79249 Transcript_34374/m.79249 type:complete len:112 (-) Transcript_34374:796-1131(-)
MICVVADQGRLAVEKLLYQLLKQWYPGTSSDHDHLLDGALREATLPQGVLNQVQGLMEVVLDQIPQACPRQWHCETNFAKIHFHPGFAAVAQSAFCPLTLCAQLPQGPGVC